MKWKDVKGYEGLYKVSDCGKIRSLPRTVNRKNGVNGSRYRTVKTRILSQGENGFGYKTVHLSKDGKSKTKYVHRLIAKAFIPNTDNKKTINHKNGIKSDNRVENLEWCSYSDNVKHAYRNGLASVTPKMRREQGLRIQGEKAPWSKLTENDVREIRKKYSTGKYTQTQLSRLYDISQQVISKVVNRELWSHVKQTGELEEI